MNLPKITITVGLLLILQGVGFYFATETKSVTALIPTFIGLPILILGIVALKESVRKHAMHGAVAMAMLGLLAPIGRIATAGLKLSTAGVSLILMIVLCASLLILGVKSFIDARRRQASAT